MTKLILVRHGETDWNKVRRIQGAGSDTPLNAAGRAQAEKLALRLKNEKIDAIYSSPLQRALNTAQAIALLHEQEVQLLPALREIEAGQLEGKWALDMNRRFDEALISGEGGEPLPRLPGGESFPEVQQRAWQAVQELVKKHSGGTVVAVSHYFVILSVVCAVIHLSLTEVIHLRSTPGSISVISFESGAARLSLFNDTCHTSS